MNVENLVDTQCSSATRLGEYNIAMEKTEELLKK